MADSRSADGRGPERQRPPEQPAVRTTIVGGRPPGAGKPVGEIPRGIEVLVKKAAVDPEFRRTLLEKRAGAAEEIGLKLVPAETMMLQTVPAAQLEAIIARTTVNPSLHAAFLGRAAAVMLAALGAGTFGCDRNEPPKPTGIAPDRPAATQPAEPATPTSTAPSAVPGLPGTGPDITAPQPVPQTTQPAQTPGADIPRTMYGVPADRPQPSQRALETPPPPPPGPVPPVVTGIQPDRPPAPNPVPPPGPPPPTGIRPDRPPGAPAPTPSPTASSSDAPAPPPAPTPAPPAPTGIRPDRPPGASPPPPAPVPPGVDQPKPPPPEPVTRGIRPDRPPAATAAPPASDAPKKDAAGQSVNTMTLPDKWDEQTLVGNLVVRLKAISEALLPGSTFSMAGAGDQRRIRMEWKPQQYDVARPSPAGDGQTLTRTETGPAEDGLLLTVWVEKDTGQNPRTQTIDNAGIWKTFHDSAYSAQLKSFLRFTVDYGPKTDKTLLAIFATPATWFKAVIKTVPAAAASQPASPGVEAKTYRPPPGDPPNFAPPTAPGPQPRFQSGGIRPDTPPPANSFGLTPDRRPSR